MEIPHRENIILAEDQGSVIIPIADLNEAIEIPFAELPDAVFDIVDTLKGEYAPLSSWLTIAVEYYKQGRLQQFEEMMTYMTSQEVLEAYQMHSFQSDHVAILNALAAYYCVHAMQRGIDTNTRRNYIQKATSQCNAITKINVNVGWVAKGLLELAKSFEKGGLEKKDFDLAESQFEFAVESTKNNIPALLGLACCKYNKGRYAEALKLYRKVLKMHPQSPGYIRLGIAHCLLRMHDYKNATTAYKRVLELDPDNVDALGGLATLELQEDTSAARVRFGELVERAYKLNPKHPVILNHLATIFFYKEAYNESRKFAEQALYHAWGSTLIAESSYQVARCYHVMGEYDRAFNHYFNATSKNPDHVLAQLGFGQMNIHKANLETSPANKTTLLNKAIECLEKVVEERSDNYHAVRLLGWLYAETDQQKKAFHILSRGTRQFPDSVEVWLELARIGERYRVYDAYQAYKKAIRILIEQGQPVPRQLSNNIGVISFKLNKLEESRKAYHHALGKTSEVVMKIRQGPKDKTKNDMDVEEPQDTKESIPMEYISIVYNLAMLDESEARYDEATRLYKAIIDNCNEYVDAYFRLGLISAEAGDFKQAAQYFEQVLTFDRENMTVFCLLGDMAYKRKNNKSAKHWYGEAMKINVKDPYAPLALSNLYISDDDSRKEKLSQCTRIYRDVLRKNPRNVYAANGLGVVLALQNELNAAKEVFVQVREASGDVENVWINLAHVYVLQEQYDNAIQMYQHVLTKFKMQNSSEMLRCLARAYYLNGNMEEAKTVLLKALHIAPANTLLWYNLGITLEDFCVRELQKKKDERSYKVTKNAVAELDRAVEIFTRLSTSDGSASKDSSSAHKKDFNSIISTKARTHLEFCRKCRENAEPHLKFAKLQEEKAKKNLEESIKKRQHAENLILEEEKRKKEEEEERKRTMEQMALLQKEKLNKLKMEWMEKEAVKSSAKEEKEKKIGKKTKEDLDFIASDDDMDLEDGDYGAGKAGREEEEEEEEESEGEEENRGADDQDDIEEDEEQRTTKSGKRKRNKKGKREKGKKKKKYQAVDDEEEEDDAAEEEEDEYSQYTKKSSSMLSDLVNDGKREKGTAEEPEEATSSKKRLVRMVDAADEEEDEMDEAVLQQNGADSAVRKQKRTKVIISDDEDDED